MRLRRRMSGRVPKISWRLNACLRWRVELNFDDIKTTMQAETLRCKSLAPIHEPVLPRDAPGPPALQGSLRRLWFSDACERIPQGVPDQFIHPRRAGDRRAP
jgi:hypothetical protein